jgi:hypothetical protein
LLAAVGNFRLQQSLRTLLGGCVLGLLTPGRVGELGRCIFVRQHERPQVAFLTLLDRALDLWALLTLVIVAEATPSPIQGSIAAHGFSA